MKEAQLSNPKVGRWIADLVLDDLDECLTPWRMDKDGILRMGSRIVVLEDEELRKEILRESHRSRFTIHPGGNKMYRDMKRTYWWEGMKKDVADFVSQCMTCQMVKAERKHPAGLLHPLEIPVWKWEDILMDFVDGLPKSRKGNKSIWVIVDRLTKSAHFIPLPSTRNVKMLCNKYIHEVV